MRLLFITDNFPPEVNAPASRTHDHAKRWRELGVDVTVVTCAPNFPHGTVYPGYRNKMFQRETVDGIRVIRVWSFITANKGFAKRVLDYLSFAFMAFWAGLFVRSDVIVATSPQFFTTFAGRALSVVKRTPWVFELRDLWPESIHAVGAMKKGRLVRWLENIELSMYHHADAVVALTPAFKRNLVDRGVPDHKIAVITNGVDRRQFAPAARNRRLRHDLGLHDGFVIGYVGTIGMAHSLDFIVRATATLNRDDIRLLIVGDGAMREDIEARAKTLAPGRIVLHPPVPKEQVRDYISACDVALVPLKRSETFKTVIPSKIFEMASMRKPILLGVDGQAREIVEGHAAGLFFEPESEADFHRAVITLADDPDQIAHLQRGAESLAEAYSRRRLADDMLDVLQRVAARAPMSQDLERSRET